MLSKRLIPCLDTDLSVPQGRVVKGVKFKQLRYAGIPCELAKKYYEEGADEICFLDITASHERRETMREVIKKTTEAVFVPITVGGGINSVEAAEKVFVVGADKVSINTSAIQNPLLITQIADKFGTQACVVAIDCSRRAGDGKHEEIKTKEGEFWFECSIFGGREFTGIDALAWAKKAESLGAGEILLTSMDCDGTHEGYDLELTRAVSEKVKVPVIASGGAGTVQHIYEALTQGKADAALLAGLLHFNELTIKEIKDYLEKKKVVIRR